MDFNGFYLYILQLLNVVGLRKRKLWGDKNHSTSYHITFALCAIVSTGRFSWDFGDKLSELYEIICHKRSPGDHFARKNFGWTEMNWAHRPPQTSKSEGEKEVGKIIPSSQLEGYDPLPSPLPLTSSTSQNNAIDCGVRCEARKTEILWGDMGHQPSQSILVTAYGNMIFDGF